MVAFHEECAGSNTVVLLWYTVVLLLFLYQEDTSENSILEYVLCMFDLKRDCSDPLFHLIPPVSPDGFWNWNAF